MKLIMRLTIAVFNRPNGNLLINIRRRMFYNSWQSLGAHLQRILYAYFELIRIVGSAKKPGSL